MTPEQREYLSWIVKTRFMDLMYAIDTNRIMEIVCDRELDFIEQLFNSELLDESVAVPPKCYIELGSTND